MCRLPEIPPDAKQTNCWKFFLYLYPVLIALRIIDNLTSYQDAGVIIVAIIQIIIEIIIFFILMYHTAYVRINVQNDNINITMGPLEWPWLRWCCSSQIKKSEVFLVSRKQRQCLWDVIPRLYCSAIQWCCCHKSYSAYYWPWCCNDINVCNLCEGDSDSSDMIQINLTQDPMEFTTMCFKRCAPCPFPSSIFCCCVYNRIAVAIKDEQVWNELQSAGYPVGLNVQPNESTPIQPGHTTDGV